MAGEIGHMIVRPGGALCDCGRRGCLEAEACGRAIAAKTRARLLDERRTTNDESANLLAAAGGRAETITAQVVALAAAQGDPLAQAILDEAARMLGAGLGVAINLMNPERVVLGGGVTKSGERWWRVVRATARDHVLPQARVDIMPAALGDNAPLWGAAALAEALI